MAHGRISNVSALICTRRQRGISCVAARALSSRTEPPSDSTSLHHLVRRHRAPQVCSFRSLRPGFRALRIVAVPGARIKIAERFILHLIELGEQLGDQSVRASMISEKVMADAVTARPPQDPEAVPAQEIASGLDMGPITQLERGVEMLVGPGFDEVDGVVI